MITSILLLVLTVLMVVIAVTVLLSLLRLVRGNAPFVPIRTSVLPTLVSQFTMSEDSVFVDIGCGEGKVLVAMAQRFPTTTIIGMENSIIPYLLARWNTRRYSNISVIRKNFLTYDFSCVTHVYTYLSPKPMAELLPILTKQCRPGTRLVSCDFVFQGKESVKTATLSRTGNFSHHLHIYEF